MELSKFGDIKNLILHLFPPEEHPENYDAAALWNLVIELEEEALKSLSIEKERDELKAERDMYREALEEIRKTIPTNNVSERMREIARNALTPIEQVKP